MINEHFTFLECCLKMIHCIGGMSSKKTNFYDIILHLEEVKLHCAYLTTCKQTIFIHKVDISEMSECSSGGKNPVISLTFLVPTINHSFKHY